MRHNASGSFRFSFDFVYKKRVSWGNRVKKSEKGVAYQGAEGQRVFVWVPVESSREEQPRRCCCCANRAAWNDRCLWMSPTLYRRFAITFYVISQHNQSKHQIIFPKPQKENPNTHYQNGFI